MRSDFKPCVQKHVKVDRNTTRPYEQKNHNSVTEYPVEKKEVKSKKRQIVGCKRKL